jgi:hypothetical protein
MCLITEIIRTCSHEKVAQAAVASMGPYFAEKVGSTAGAQGLSAGAFAARAVREFEKLGGEKEWRSLRQAMDGSDQPILTGLQHILWPLIEQGTEASLADAKPAQRGPHAAARPYCLSPAG